MTEEGKKYQTCKVSVYTHEIIGYCPMVSLGDKLVFDDMLYLDVSKISKEVLFEKRHLICPWVIYQIFPFVLAMCKGVSAVELGISQGEEDGYVQCEAWGPPECHAKVVLRLHAEPIERGFTDRFYDHCAKIGWLAIPDNYIERHATFKQKEAWQKNWKKVAKDLKLKVEDEKK